MSQPVPLTPTLHSQTRVRNEINASRFEGQQILPLIVHEISQAGSECPVVFIKNPETDQFQTVALLGLAQGENLMIRNHEWQGNYMPGVLTGDPFRLMAVAADSDQMTLGIDESSPLVGVDEGELLFDDSGKPTAYLDQRRDTLVRYFEHDRVTRVFVAKLVELELLVSKELTIEIDGQKSTMGGIYLVDENKLRELEDEPMLDLQRRGFLSAIHAHLMSQNQMRNLARIKVMQQQEAAK